MSKKQERLHKSSLMRIAAYEALPSTTKPSHTRPGEVSCKRVETREDKITVASALRTVGNKGAGVDLTKKVIDFTGKLKEVIGIKTRGKCDFLRRMGFAIIGI